MDRRKFVKMAGVAAAAGATGCVGGNGNGDGNGDGGDDGDGDGDGMEDGGDGPDPTVGQDGEATDMTGQDEVEVEVGAGDGFKFNPADIIVDAGTTVVWTWTGEGGQHNVVEADGDEPLDDPSFESELVGDEGHEFTHTFEESGSYDYVCSVHINQGMLGSVQVEGDGGGAPSTEGQDGNATDLTGQDEANVDVGAGDSGFRFDPADIIVDAGTTVVWTWTGEGGQHNVVESDGDEPLDDPSFESELVGDEGHEFTHTFEDPGTYDYVCEVHINQGMIGSVQVEEGGMEGDGMEEDGMDGNETDGMESDGMEEDGMEEDGMEG